MRAPLLVSMLLGLTGCRCQSISPRPVYKPPARVEAVEAVPATPAEPVPPSLPPSAADEAPECEGDSCRLKKTGCAPSAPHPAAARPGVPAALLYAGGALALFLSFGVGLLVGRR